MCVCCLNLVINDFDRNDEDLKLCSIGVHIRKNFAFFFFFFFLHAKSKVKIRFHHQGEATSVGFKYLVHVFPVPILRLSVE